jgi:hypothetical protein
MVWVGVMDRQERMPPRSQLDEPANDNGEIILLWKACTSMLSVAAGVC